MIEQIFTPIDTAIAGGGYYIFLIKKSLAWVIQTESFSEITVNIKEFYHFR